MARRRQEARAEELHAKTFTVWINHQRARKQYPPIGALFADLATGVPLLQLLEVLYDTPIPAKYNPNPTTEIQRIENVAIALNWLQQRGVNVQINSKGS